MVDRVNPIFEVILSIHILGKYKCSFFMVQGPEIGKKKILILGLVIFLSNMEKITFCIEK